MTDQKPPNCSTCTNDNCDWHPDQVPFPEEVIFFVSDLREVVKEMGCLSHPGARAYLMKDVIEELELKKVTLKTYMPLAYREGGTRMLDFAIDLIRDGVKK